MILPTSYAAVLILTLLTIVCWGSWVSTFKWARGWRFELFYFDYAAGVVIAAAVAALTFGSMGDDLSFFDNLSIAGKRNMAMALVAGSVFNLGNMLLLAAVSIAGMAVVFPLSLGLALVIGVLWKYFMGPAVQPLFVFGGISVAVVAIIVAAVALRAQTSKKARLSSKGLIISSASGLLLGSFYPLIDKSRATDIGLGPYTCAVFFAIGVAITTVVYDLYFINLPVQGQAVSLRDYFTSKARQHLLGLLGGIIWCIGLIAILVASGASPTVALAPVVSYAIGHVALIVAALWGVLVWKEQGGLLFALMLILFLAGIGLISMSPLPA